MLMNFLMVQIHEYMLSKAPPVPQLSTCEERPGNREGEAQASSIDAMVSGAGEGLPAPVGDRIIEEVQEDVPASVNPNPVVAGTSREVPANASGVQLQPKPETRVQKPADDRLFTWAAVGLTIAILVLLLRKFMKSNGHGAVFMDGS